MCHLSSNHTLPHACMEFTMNHISHHLSARTSSLSSYQHAQIFISCSMSKRASRMITCAVNQDRPGRPSSPSSQRLILFSDWWETTEPDWGGPSWWMDLSRIFNEQRPCLGLQGIKVTPLSFWRTFIAWVIFLYLTAWLKFWVLESDWSEVEHYLFLEKRSGQKVAPAGTWVTG